MDGGRCVPDVGGHRSVSCIGEELGLCASLLLHPCHCVGTIATNRVAVLGIVVVMVGLALLGATCGAGIFLICDDFYDSPAASSRHQCFSGHPAPQLELCKERDCFSLNVSMKELP